MEVLGHLWIGYEALMKPDSKFCFAKFSPLLSRPLMAEDISSAWFIYCTEDVSWLEQRVYSVNLCLYTLYLSLLAVEIDQKEASEQAVVQPLQNL